MPLDFIERRKSVHLASTIDNALSLAEMFGWRYAIPYLISERVPAPVIQRLLQGDGRFRNPASKLSTSACVWTASIADEMKNLFDSLGDRNSNHADAYDEL